jgi:hypothetical protein
LTDRRNWGYSRSMYQIYFLSILTNVLAGIALGFDRMDERLRLRSVFNPELFQNAGFRLAIGISAFVIGFLKLLSVSPDDVAVVGDLVPALTGMLSGFALAFQYYQERTTSESGTVASLDRIFGRHSATLGMVALIAGVVHLFLHRILFL